MSLHSSNIEIHPSLIAKTGTGSLSFGGAALLLEDMLAKAKSLNDKEIEKDLQKQKPISTSRIANTYQDHDRIRFGDDEKPTSETLSLIFNLVDIYKQMNEEDILRGLYKQLHAGDDGANNVFDLKMGKNTKLSLKKLREMFLEGEYGSAEDRPGYQRYLSQEIRENLHNLNKWDDLVKDIHNDPDYAESSGLKSCFADSEDAFNITNITRLRRTDRYYILRGMLNDDNYWEPLRESADYLMT